MTAKVETYFIEPLEAHFEDQPTDGVRDTILTDMETHDEEILNQAVEWLKRNRQSQKTFPSPKECAKAVAAILSEIAQVNIATRFEAPAGATYGAKLKEWVKTGGLAHTILKKTFQWKEWEIYFLATDNKVQYPTMMTRDSWTVPTQVPKAFDHHYNWELGDRLLREREKAEDEMASPERQQKVHEILLNLRV